MARVKTNDMTLTAVTETSLEVAPSTGWFILQFDQLSDYGADVKQVARDPISKNRQLERGTTVDLDSKVTVTMDWTYFHAYELLPQFMMSKWLGAAVFTPTAVTATAYTVASGGALAAGTLVYARGFTNAANNGLKVVSAGSTGTSINAPGLVIEASPPSNVLLEICGVMGAAADITIDASGNLNSTILDFTTLSIQVGQGMYVGDTLVTNCSFATVADTGYVRVKSVAAHQIVLDKWGQAFSADTGTGKTIRLYYGQFLTNWPVDNANFIEASKTFELTYINLDVGPATMYEYSGGNYANTLSLNLPLANKATMQCEWLGVDANPPVSAGSRKAGASTAIAPFSTAALNTSAEIGRLRFQKLDATGFTSFFKNVTIKLMNNVSGEKALANLGPVLMNYGDFEVQIDATIMLTDPAVISLVRSATPATADFAIANVDGGFWIDVPQFIINSGKREFPKNASVLVKGQAKAFRDSTLGTSCSFTRFPYVPVDFTLL